MVMVVEVVGDVYTSVIAGSGAHGQLQDLGGDTLLEGR